MSLVAAVRAVQNVSLVEELPSVPLRTLELLATNIAKVGGKINYGKTKVYLRDGVLSIDILVKT